MLHCDKRKLGRASHLEKDISGFKFQGPGIYNFYDRTILVIPVHAFESIMPDMCPVFSPAITKEEVKEIWTGEDVLCFDVYIWNNRFEASALKKVLLALLSAPVYNM